MASIDRTAYPRLGKSLGKEELQARYELNDEERRFIGISAKGRRQTLTLAVLLKTRQQLGYFPALRNVTLQIKQYLSEQLNCPPDTQYHDENRLRTSLHRYRHAAREYLGSKPYSSGGREHAAKIIHTAAHTMSDPADLINAAVEDLIKANIELPAFSALDRLAGHIRQKVHEELYTRMTDALAPDQQEILEALLVVAPGGQFTPFNQLKQTPGTPTLGHVRLWAEHLHRIEAILDPAPFLVNIAHTKIRQFAAEADALQVSDMLDIHQPGKRHALLLCLLHQAQTRTRDELVEMFLRRMRRTKNAAQDKLQRIQEQHRDIEENLVFTLGQILHKAKTGENTPRDLGDDVLMILDEQGGTDHLLRQYQSVSAYHQNNYLPLLWDIHAQNRSVLFRLLELLNIEAANQDSRLIDALSYVIRHRHSRLSGVNYFGRFRVN